MNCVVCGEPASAACSDCAAFCCAKHQAAVGGIAARAQGMFRCPTCEARYLEQLRQPQPAGVGVTWFEKFSALWTYIELECQSCRYAWPVKLLVFLIAVVPAILGFLIPVFPLGALGEERRWYK